MTQPVKNRHPILAVVFRLLLALSVWDGPVLWGHTHNSDSASLRDHVARLHKGDASDVAFRWHWHFSIPERGGTEPTNGSRPANPDRTISLTLSGLETTSAGSLSSDAIFADNSQMSSRNCGRAGVNSPSGAYMRAPGVPQQVVCRQTC